MGGSTNTRTTNPEVGRKLWSCIYMIGEILLMVNVKMMPSMKFDSTTKPKIKLFLFRLVQLQLQLIGAFHSKNQLIILFSSDWLGLSQFYLQKWCSFHKSEERLKDWKGEPWKIVNDNTFKVDRQSNGSPDSNYFVWYQLLCLPFMYHKQLYSIQSSQRSQRSQTWMDEIH